MVSQHVSAAITAEGRTCQIEEMRLFQECRMRKGTGGADAAA